MQGEAQFTVRFAGPLVTYQDSGRTGTMRFGVARSGPMDRVAFAAAHAALGNGPGLTAIEISLGGLILECDLGPVTIAIAGGDFSIEQGSTIHQGWKVLTVHQGERLAIRAGRGGSWAYLAFAGRLKTKHWLGSAATHSTSGFGGGGLTAGQPVKVTQAETRPEREGEIPMPPGYGEGSVFRVVLGPQDRWFSETAKQAFLSGPYRLTDSYDRMGVKLEGTVLKTGDALAIPSEPVLRGSVQVSGDGTPTILLADHQTTGGYPKIATMISVDTDRLVQMRSQQSIRFEAVTSEQAVEITRESVGQLDRYLATIAVPRGNLLQRLMRENLVSGVALDELDQES